MHPPDRVQARLQLMAEQVVQEEEFIWCQH